MDDRFDPRELLLQRARERLEGQQEGTGNYLVLPDGCNWCRIKAEEMAFDFVPYVNKDAQHPDRVPAGVPWPRLPFWRHSNLGAENKKALCLKSVHKPCPVCEERQRLISDGADRKLTDGLRASYRELYLLLDDRDEFQVLEMAYSNFGKTLDRKIARLNNEMAMFYDLERGHTVIAWFVEESIGRSTFLEVDEIEFEKRKPIKASLLEDAPDLAECLRPLTYDRLRALYLDLDPDEVGGDADPEPTARRGRSRPEPDPEPATRRRQRTEPAPDPEPDDVPEGFTICVACEGSGKNSRGRACPICNGEGIKELADDADAATEKCPHGHRFGVDTDESDDCADCDVWKDCARTRETAESPPVPPPQRARGRKPDAEPDEPPVARTRRHSAPADERSNSRDSDGGGRRGLGQRGGRSRR